MNVVSYTCTGHDCDSRENAVKEVNMRGRDEGELVESDNLG